MALSFTKNLSNYADFGVATIGDLLDGKTGLTLSFAMKTNGTISGSLDNDMIYIWVDGSKNLLSVVWNGGRMQCNARPDTDETFAENLLSASSVDVDDGNWHYQCFAWDFANDVGGNLTDGVGGGYDTPSIFTGSVIANSNTTNLDGIGAKIPAGGPDDTDRMFAGQMAHIALYDVYLNRGEATSLSAGYSPLLIRPKNLIFYKPLDGTLGDGRDSTNSPALSITGSVPYVAGPDFKPPTSPSIA